MSDTHNKLPYGNQVQQLKNIGLSLRPQLFFFSNPNLNPNPHT